MLVQADRLGRQIGRQGEAAVRAARRAVVDDPVGILGEDATVAVMARLGSARARLLPPFFAISRRRFGRGPRRLCRPLKLQHQFDQLVLAQALKINPSHDGMESAFGPQRKGVMSVGVRHRPADHCTPPG